MHHQETGSEPAFSGCLPATAQILLDGAEFSCAIEQINFSPIT
jgi:hypothetical protein